ncbi:MAG TPA: glycosyltransferase family 39 protein [Candidatus Krumholzibacteria bacterium]|nr:glycosyltransferase family 39 protein [Candidatus Krumholzibacteria bacterium]
MALLPLPPRDRVRGTCRWLGALTVLALCLRLFRLGAQSIWIDEGMSLGWIGEIEARGWRTVLQDIHGPLHALAIYAASRISSAEWCLRLPSALAGSLAVPALAALVRRLWGERVALLAAVLATFSPFGLYYSQEVRNYAFTLLFASLMLLAALDCAQRPRPLAAGRLVLVELLGILSNLNGLFLAGGVQVWLFLVWRRSRRALVVWAASQVLLGVLLLPYFLQVQKQVRAERLVGVEAGIGESEPLRGDTTLHPMGLPYTAYTFAAGYSLGPTLEELRRDPGAALAWRHLPALALVLAGFGVPFVVGLLKRASWPAAWLLVVPSLAVAACTLWLAALNIKPFNPRYLSVLQPAFLALVAQGIWSLPRRGRIVIATIALVGSLWSCGNYLFVPRYGRDDTRGVVEYLLAHAGAKDLVLHINLGFSLRYYDRLPQQIRLAEPGSGDSPEAARRYLDRIVGDAPVLWYLECRPEKLDPAGHLRQACGERAYSSSTRSFVGIQVHRFQLEPPPRLHPLRPPDPGRSASESRS